MARRACDDPRHHTLIGEMLDGPVVIPFALIGLALATIASCAVPSIVECGDGRICPGGSVCTPRGCSLLGLCGDGIIDDGEQCDDGNRTSADGCSSTCVSEACNNGTIDQGEACDDGNALSHDGCSSGCLVERPNWYELMRTGPPGPLAGASAAWIPDRGRALLYGGTDLVAPRADAWWWDGGTWTPAPSGPPALHQHGMASDGAGRVLVFGGLAPSAPSNECWLWDMAWTRCTGPLPPARQAPALAAGASSGEVVLYGGHDAGAFDARTWRWSSAGWSDLQRPGPPAYAPAIAFDSVANEHVLVHTASLPARTWKLAAAGWTSVEDKWKFRQFAPVVYDADRGVMVVVAGEDEFVGLHNEALEQAASGWREIPVTARPPSRRSHASFHDPIRHAIVVFGGSTDLSALADTWVLRWESSTLDENCVITTDADNDGLAGCADPDCWGRCDPRCAPRDPECDPARPRCGDGMCNTDLESVALCPGDCT